MSEENKTLLDCYKRSVKLLVKNRSNYGILAANRKPKARSRNYLSVFGRDASICALGMLASGDRRLIACAKKSLNTLGRYQAENGQIPNYVRVSDRYVDFWKMGCIDATLWWLVAVKFYESETADSVFIKKNKLRMDKALAWLKCQEHPADGLLVQNEASDWADIMPRTGKVLYTNALWFRVKKLYGLKDLKKTKDNFNSAFYPFGSKLADMPPCLSKTARLMKRESKMSGVYASYVNYTFWGEDVDVFGNSLALLFGLPDKKLKAKVIRSLMARHKKKKLPVPVLFNPLKEGDRMWRRYMQNHDLNSHGQYHNGGIWPFASCFWAMVLKQAGRRQEAEAELLRIARANSLGRWDFNEWMHSRTGELLGMPGQSWNAAMFIFAYHYLKGEVKI